MAHLSLVAMILVAIALVFLSTLPHFTVNVSITGLYQWVTFACPPSSAA